jgi:hypothetical protein
MSDDETSNGLTGWAGVTLGRLWAEHDRSVDETLAWFGNRHRRQLDPAALLAQNQAFAAENAQLRQELADYKRNFTELDAWAKRAERQIAQLLKEREE